MTPSFFRKSYEIPYSSAEGMHRACGHIRHKQEPEGREVPTRSDREESSHITKQAPNSSLFNEQSERCNRSQTGVQTSSTNQRITLGVQSCQNHGTCTHTKTTSKHRCRMTENIRRRSYILESHDCRGCMREMCVTDDTLGVEEGKTLLQTPNHGVERLENADRREPCRGRALRTFANDILQNSPRGN